MATQRCFRKTTATPVTQTHRSFRTMCGRGQQFPLRPQKIETKLPHGVLNPIHVPFSCMNNTTLGTSYSSRIRWIDIEVLNPFVDKSSKNGQTCYPYGTFYLMAFALSYGTKGSLAPTYLVSVRLIRLTVRQAFALTLYRPCYWSWAYRRATPLPFRSLLPQENYP